MLEAFKGLLTGFNPEMDLRAGMPGFNPPGLLGPAGAGGSDGLLTAPTTPGMGSPGLPPAAPPGAPQPPAAPQNPLVTLFKETYESLEPKDDSIWDQLAVFGLGGTQGLAQHATQKKEQQLQQTLSSVYAVAAQNGLPPEAALQAYAMSGYADPEILAKMAQLDMDRQKLAIDQGRFGWEVQSGMPDFKGDVSAAEAAGKAPYAPYQKITSENGDIWVQPGVTDGVIPGRDESGSAIDQERRLAQVKREEARVDKAFATIEELNPKIDNLTYIGSLLAQVPDEIELGGPGAEKLQEVRQLAIGLGLNKEAEYKDTTALLEAIRAETEKMIGAVRPEGAGATSDLEYKSYKEAVASLGKTKEGNRRVIEYNLESLERARDRARFITKWHAEGRDMRKVDDAWEKVIKANPASWMN